jgi:hypothetical protein
MHIKKYISILFLFTLLFSGCGNSVYKGKCKVNGLIRNYTKNKIELYEITQSKNYPVSDVKIGKDGEFEVEFEAEEKSIYGITNGTSFIYFINDVPELSIETSEDEFDNYFTEGSRESEQLRELIVTEKKMATEMVLAEKILSMKMTSSDVKLGYSKEILELENQADKRTLEHRNYMTIILILFTIRCLQLQHQTF